MQNRTSLPLIIMGIFSIFGCSKTPGPPPTEQPTSQLAFVLLQEATLPDSDELVAAFQRFSGPDESISFSEAENSGDSTVMSVDLVGVGTAFIAVMPLPIPNGEAEAHFEYSLSSFQDDAFPPAHEAHLMVTLMPINQERTPTEAMMAFTSLLAAIGEVTPSTGVYWGNAGATHSMSYFLTAASEYSITPRVTLWTGLSRAPESEDRMSYLSLGMNQLALPELYLVCPREKAGEAMGMFFDLLSYVIERGAPIPEGDTIGGSEDQKIPVHYVKSPADPESIVWRVELK